jgi:hypothetical protein
VKRSEGRCDSSEAVPNSRPRPDGTLVKALARAWRWQRLLDGGVYTSVTEISEAEGINKSYISRILRLALLAPDTVAAVLAGKADQALMLERLERPLPASWEEQRGRLAQRTHVLRTTSAFVCEMPYMQVSGQTPSSMAFRGRGPPSPIFYFLVSALAAPGFGFVGAVGTVPADAGTFFLSALGFLASRLLLF